MAQLYQRRCRLLISVPVDTPGDFTHTTTNEIEINGGVTDIVGKPGMRVTFNITRTDKKEPNTNKVVVTNLSASTRSALQTKGVKLTLEAGYASVGTTRIFRGDVRTVDHVRNDASWDTTFQVGDGERAYQNARVGESFAPGTNGNVILNYLANASGLQIGNVADVDLSRVRFDSGYVVAGKWQQAMQRFCASVGYSWSVQDETLQVLAPDGEQPGLIPLISPQTGLIGSPEMGSPETKGKPQLVKFVSLLKPARPGGLVHLKSDRYDSDVRIKKVNMRGDTHGDDWYTEYEGIIQKTPTATKS